MVSTPNPPDVASFINQGYCYNLIVTQIPHDAGLATLCPPDRTQERCVRGNVAAYADL